MVGESNQNVFLIQIDASSFAKFEISEFDISRFDCSPKTHFNTWGGRVQAVLICDVIWEMVSYGGTNIIGPD